MLAGARSITKVFIGVDGTNRGEEEEEKAMHLINVHVSDVLCWVLYPLLIKVLLAKGLAINQANTN